MYLRVSIGDLKFLVGNLMVQGWATGFMVVRHLPIVKALNI
jgi:hypothetical protein